MFSCTQICIIYKTNRIYKEDKSGLAQAGIDRIVDQTEKSSEAAECFTK